MTLAQGRAGIRAEPVGEALADAFVDGERVRLAPLRGERVHQERGRPLVRRMLGEEGRQPGDGVVGTAEHQLGLGQIRGRLDDGALQPRRDRRSDRGDHRRFVVERDGPAQRLRSRAGIPGAQPVAAVRREPLEPQDVDVVRCEAEAVTALGPQHRPAPAEQPAQPGDERLEGVRRVGGQLPPPQRVDQRPRLDRPPSGQRQPREQPADPGPGDVHDGVTAPHLELAEERHPQPYPLIPAHATILPRTARRPKPGPGPTCPGPTCPGPTAPEPRRPDAARAGVNPSRALLACSARVLCSRALRGHGRDQCRCGTFHSHGRKSVVATVDMRPRRG